MWQRFEDVNAIYNCQVLALLFLLPSLFLVPAKAAYEAVTQGVLFYPPFSFISVQIHGSLKPVLLQIYPIEPRSSNTKIKERLSFPTMQGKE